MNIKTTPLTELNKQGVNKICYVSIFNEDKKYSCDLSSLFLFTADVITLKDFEDIYRVKIVEIHFDLWE